MIVDQPIAQPQHPVKAEIAVQAGLYIGARQLRIAVGVQQALLGGDHQPGPVAIERAAFEHPVGRLDGKSSITGQFSPDLLIPLHQILAAPAVEAKAHGDRLASPIHHQRAGIAQPDVAVTPHLQLHRRRTQLGGARAIGLVPHDQPHLLPAVRNCTGKLRDLFLRAAQEPRPFIGKVREAHPQPALRMPFGRHHRRSTSCCCGSCRAPRGTHRPCASWARRCSSPASVRGGSRASRPAPGRTSPSSHHTRRSAGDND